jgi:pyruvate/2-oxoglutarate/acetoin dehydrogenase E1 component
MTKTYKQALTDSMATLAGDPARRFVGYGLTHGRCAGTLAAARPEQIIETPVAENLMAGAAIGLSLAGLKPVVFIERADFLLNALDAIVNHLDKIALLSRGEFKPAVILRIVVGNSKKPLFTGATHTQNFAFALQQMVSFPVYELLDAEKVETCYLEAVSNQDRGVSTALFEFKDLL